MAFTVGNENTVAWSNASSVVLTKPTGTAEGNALIAHIGHSAAVSVVPTGWTLIDNQSTGNTVQASLYYKLATSSEPADYTWEFGSSNNCAGAIFRITGAATAFVDVSGAATVTDTADPSFANGVTPSNANSLILFFVTADDNQNDVTGYAIATDNPSWTELYDVTNASEDNTIAMAYATRTQTTATGNSSVTGLGATGDADSAGHLVVVKPAVPLTASVDLINLPIVINQFTLPVVVPSPLDIVLSPIDPTFLGVAFDFSNVSKNSASPSNVSKNAASPSNQSKNSASFTNLSKS